jgi:TolB-like protein
VITGSLDQVGGTLQVDAYLFRAGAVPALWVERLEWNATERSSVPLEVANRVREVIQRPY